MTTLSILGIPVRTDLQLRLVKVSNTLVNLHAAMKLAHDEPEVDAILQKVEHLLAAVHQEIDQLRTLQQASRYTESATSADLASKATRQMSDLLQKASILLKQRASKP